MEKFDLSVYDVAEMLKLSPRTIRNYITNGELYAIKIGKQYRISPSSLSKFKREHLSTIKEGGAYE
ncbi:MAG: helix-turn-helix domain-containing protein [Thermotogae bacterium]|nr:helix-turn-helix domain-containing protein [Thermotogota bacterium]